MHKYGNEGDREDGTSWCHEVAGAIKRSQWQRSLSNGINHFSSALWSGKQYGGGGGLQNYEGEGGPEKDKSRQIMRDEHEFCERWGVDKIGCDR